jgi:hypothetical protein
VFPVVNLVKPVNVSLVSAAHHWAPWNPAINHIALRSRLHRNSRRSICLARLFSRARRRTYWLQCGTSARTSLILTEITFREPNQRKGVPP